MAALIDVAACLDVIGFTNAAETLMIPSSILTPKLMSFKRFTLKTHSATLNQLRIFESLLNCHYADHHVTLIHPTG